MLTLSGVKVDDLSSLLLLSLVETKDRVEAEHANCWIEAIAERGKSSPALSEQDLILLGYAGLIRSSTLGAALEASKGLMMFEAADCGPHR